jgi:hypothetical protein
MRERIRWSIVTSAALLFTAAIDSGAQMAGELRVGAGQHVRVTTITGDTIDGYVTLWSGDRIQLRHRSFAGDTVVSVTRADVDRAELAVPQANGIRNAAIGGAVGLAAGALFGSALEKGRSCSDAAPRLCEVGLSAALLPMLGFTVGLLGGWIQRPEAWVPLAKFRGQQD